MTHLQDCEANSIKCKKTRGNIALIFRKMTIARHRNVIPNRKRKKKNNKFLRKNYPRRESHYPLRVSLNY